MPNRWEKKWKQWQILYCLAPKSLQTVTVGMKLKDVAPWKKSYGKPRRHLKKQRHRFAGKDPYSQSCVFSSNYMQMSELDHKEGWVPKNGCFPTVVLEKNLESPLDCNKIQPVHPKGNQSWIFTASTDAEVEAPILWSPGVKSQLFGKVPDGRDWGHEEKRVTEEEMVGWHHWLNGHEFEQTLEDSEEQGSLACVLKVTESQMRLSDWTTTRLR